MKRWVVFFVLFASALYAKPIRVVVTLPPQIEWVEAIGQDRVSVTSLLPVGANHELYEPSPAQISALSRAQVFVRIGELPFETANASRFNHLNKRMAIVNLSDHTRLINDGHVDPHLWLSPKRVMLHLPMIRDALCALDPASTAFYFQNTERYNERLAQLDRRIQTSCASTKGKRVLIFHPFLSYFAQDYGFGQLAIEVEGKPPTPRQLQALVKTARREGLSNVISQPQASLDMARTIAHELNGKVIVIDPLKKEYAQNIWAIAKTVCAELKGEKE